MTAELDAIRESYDTVAVDYADLLRDALAASPHDRAVLGLFAELVLATGDGPVLDVGCGPGRITGHLARLGLDAFGIDLSPGMVEVARRAYPSLPFSVGSMFALDLADGSLAGLVAYYSIVNIPRAELPAVFAEFARVLAPGGVLLMVFLVGDEVRHGTEWLGHPIDLHVYRNQPDAIAGLLSEAGLPVRMTTIRRPDDDGVEFGPRAYLLVTRSSGPA